MTEMEERVEAALRRIDPDMMPSMYGRMFRATFEAMREPTPEMLEAGAAAGSPESPALPHEVWPAMIDAAIGKAP